MVKSKNSKVKSKVKHYLEVKDGDFWCQSKFSFWIFGSQHVLAGGWGHAIQAPGHTPTGSPSSHHPPAFRADRRSQVDRELMITAIWHHLILAILFSFQVSVNAICKRWLLDSELSLKTDLWLWRGTFQLVNCAEQSPLSCSCTALMSQWLCLKWFLLSMRNQSTGRESAH